MLASVTTLPPLDAYRRMSNLPKTSARRAPIFSPATSHSGKEAVGKQKPSAIRYKATTSPFPHELLLLKGMHWHCFLSLITWGGGSSLARDNSLLIKKQR